MKGSYEEDLANHFGLQRRGRLRQRICLERPCGGKRRPAIELRNHHFRVSTSSRLGEGHIVVSAFGKEASNAAESANRCMCFKS